MSGEWGRFPRIRSGSCYLLCKGIRTLARPAVAVVVALDSLPPTRGDGGTRTRPLTALSVFAVRQTSWPKTIGPNNLPAVCKRMSGVRDLMAFPAAQLDELAGIFRSHGLFFCRFNQGSQKR